MMLIVSMMISGINCNKLFLAIRNADISTSNYLEDTSAYLKQVQSVLRPAIFLAKMISANGLSALVHCEDGCDITSIVVSLTKLQLDPHYRTLSGFLELIEEDFGNFGFKFMERMGHASRLLPRSSDVAYSPTFTIFLDAVWQITQQYASAFEFNESFLWSIYEASCCGSFGKGRK
jgi:hypothetical protein